MQPLAVAAEYWCCRRHDHEELWYTFRQKGIIFSERAGRTPPACLPLWAAQTDLECFFPSRSRYGVE